MTHFTIEFCSTRFATERCYVWQRKIVEIDGIIEHVFLNIDVAFWFVLGLVLDWPILKDVIAVLTPSMLIIGSSIPGKLLNSGMLTNG